MERSMHSFPLPSRLKIIDTTGQTLTGEPLFPFAFEEVLCRQVGQGATPVLHLWRHERAFVMGLRDRKLPFVHKAMQWLEQEGYRAAVRHSGGAAVPLDNGVINLTLILPKPPGVLDYRYEFELMAHFIQLILHRWTQQVDIGEIAGSYCPGDFDLSIRGRKFCGIAQRRQVHASIIQSFIVVEGGGVQRAEVVQRFYQLAQGHASQIQTSSMASLSELINFPSCDVLISEIQHVLHKFHVDVEIVHHYDSTLFSRIEHMISQLQQRYDK